MKPTRTRSTRTIFTPPSTGTPPNVQGGKKRNNLLASPGLMLTGWAKGLREFTIAPASPLRGAAQPVPTVDKDFFSKSRDNTKSDIGPFNLTAR